MSTLTISNKNIFDFDFKPLTQGVSDPAEKTLVAAYDALNHFTETNVNKSPIDRLKEELNSILYECRSQNWDGHTAKPISYKAIEHAMRYATSLPKEISFPEATPEPDGEVALEWYGRNGSVFSISFGENGTISYAGLFSENKKTHGVEDIDSLDKEILEKYISRALSN